MDPDPVFCLDVVSMGLLGKPCANGLLGREESLLRLGCFVEPSCGLFVGSGHAQYPNFLREVCIKAAPQRNLSPPHIYMSTPYLYKDRDYSLNHVSACIYVT